MARQRKSIEQLRLSGAFARNPGRYQARHEPADERPIGDAPGWLAAEAQAAWRDLVPNLPWLRYSHRGIVEITAIQIGKMRTGELGVQGMNLLRQCLGKLGATPADAAKVSAPPNSEPDDPAAKYFQ